MSDQPNLDALREACVGMAYAEVDAEAVLTVLALVEEQRKEIERLREALADVKLQLPAWFKASRWIIDNALAGSPAEKETTDA